MVVIVSGLFFILALVSGASRSATTTYPLFVDAHQTSITEDEPVAIENDQRSFKITLALCTSQAGVLVANHLVPGGVSAFCPNHSTHFKLHQVLRI
jgi:hypothetical protein